jgi:MFS family permease
MQDWKALLATPRFRSLWLALVCNNLGSWCVMAALPILVAERFGAGSELVLSLGLRILPKILLAPISGGFLRRYGAIRVAGCALVAEGVLTAALPWCYNFALLQVVIAAIGTLDVFVNPSLLSLRGPSTPPGLSMAANTLCSVADRSAKIVGPIVGGIAVLGGFVPAFLAFGLAILCAAIPVSRLKIAPETPAENQRFIASPMEFVAMLRGDRILTGLLIAAVTYMVMLGGLRPFLFWANRDWYGASDTAWTGLLAAQGVGALIGAFAAGLLGRRLQRWMSAYGLTLVTGILEGVLHLALLLTVNGTQAMIVLAAASIPEILSTATWFTAMQERLTPTQQGIFFTFAMPVWDCAFALGVMSAGLHANGSLSLTAFWTLVSLSATLPLVPLLAMHGWRDSCE